MRNLMHTEPTFTATQFPPAADALAISALHTTREAIARWSGKLPAHAAALPRDQSRVSPQARWLAETQRGLAAFVERGGFAQFEGAGAPLSDLLTPTMYCLSDSEKANVCID